MDNQRLGDAIVHQTHTFVYLGWRADYALTTELALKIAQPPDCVWSIRAEQMPPILVVEKSEDGLAFFRDLLLKSGYDADTLPPVETPQEMPQHVLLCNDPTLAPAIATAIEYYMGSLTGVLVVDEERSAEITALRASSRQEPVDDSLFDEEIIQ